MTLTIRTESESERESERESALLLLLLRSACEGGVRYSLRERPFPCPVAGEKISRRQRSGLSTHEI